MSNRRFHQDSRLSENFTEQGLQSLTGESRRKWARYVVKELVDNAIEAAEDHATTPAIDVTIETTGTPTKVSKVVVSDNGPGIPESDIATVFEDVSQFAGSKRHYCLPTRGNQGNALMTILGIQYLSQRPLVVESDNTRHSIEATEDSITSEHTIERTTEPCDVDGTRITVDFHSGYYCRAGQVRETLGAFVALNPHVQWSISTDGKSVYEATSDPSVEQFSVSQKATTGKAVWFSYDDFKERLKADARADESLTLEDAVTEFAKLTTKADSIFAGLEQYREQTVATFLREQDDGTIRQLYENMCAETSTYSERTLDRTLGSVGNDLTHSLHNYLRFTDRYDDVATLASNLSEYGDIDRPEDMTLYYSDGDIIDSGSKTIPFNFELAVLPKADESARTSIEFGINQSISYSTPGISVDFSDTNGEQSAYDIAGAFSSTLEHGYHVVTNLTCPNLDFQDKGKQSFNTEPFESVASEVVGKAIRKVQRDIRPVLNDLRSEDDPLPQKLPNKAPRGFIGEFVESHFEDAYNTATEGGQYTIEMRQLFYAMRPLFYDIAERRGYEYANGATLENPKPLQLDYDYFSQLVADYETEQLGQRVVHRDNRGFFVEPHSNKRIDLQTVDVEQYEPDLDKFNTLLFVEKTGFFKLIHQDFELTKKYDIGLINSKGYSTLAGRKLIEKVKERGDIQLLTLTDLDINGLGIADDATEADELSVVDQFDATRIGITREDVDEYNLPVESRSYTEKQETQLMNRVEAGEITAEVAKFLLDNDGQAVEINALTPAELRTYLTDKFAEHGVGKVIPDEEDIGDPEKVKDEAISRAVGSWVMDKTKEEIETDVEDSVGTEDTTSEEILSRILEKMDKKPAKGWQDLEEEVQDGIKEEWADEAREYLDDNVSIEISIDD